MTTNSKLTKKDFRQMYTRSCTLDSAWNYERQQNMNFCYMMIPVLKRLYSDNPEEMKKGLQRHLEFMSCTPHLVTFLGGITAAMEEEHASNPEFEEATIGAVKTSLMGPLAGFGDSLFWGTLLTIAVGIGTSFASQGSIVGPILFFLIINVPGFLARFYSLNIGYKTGSKFFTSMTSDGVIERVMGVVSILGLMVIGSMAASMITITIPLEVGVNGAMEPLQTYIDQIMPALLPAVVFGIMYWLLGKNVKTTRILIGLVIISCICTFFGIL